MSSSPEALPRPMTASAVAASQGDDVEASDTDMRIVELTAKIDRLTDLVLTLQAQSMGKVSLS
jgi:ABC-type uncharacterized transport system fused permease/ATPase subunit